MMNLHYIDEYKEVDISEIVFQIFDIHDCEDIKELLSARWDPMLIEIIDDAIISYLDLDGIIRLGKDLENLREEVIDRLRYMFK